jgi:hypothetical protein
MLIKQGDVDSRIRSYYLQSVTFKVVLNIVASVPILQIWHNNKRFVIQLVYTKEF